MRPPVHLSLLAPDILKLVLPLLDIESVSLDPTEVWLNRPTVLFKSQNVTVELFQLQVSLCPVCEFVGVIRVVIGHLNGYIWKE